MLSPLVAVVVFDEHEPPIECDFPEFAVDLKSIHPPSDLLEWSVRGLTLGHTSPLIMTWEMEELSDDYEIYMYVGDISYNLRTEDTIQINPEDLFGIYEYIDGEYLERLLYQK